MKKILLFIVFCLMINHLSAQNEMWIYKSNGNIIKYNTAEIDSITFMPIQEADIADAPFVTAEVTSSSTIVLKWNAVEGATSYNIYSGTSLLANTTYTTYTVAGLNADTEYSFTVRTVNEVGESEDSNTVKARTLPDEDYIISIEANQLVGNYYGDSLVGDGSLYFIIFSKDGLVNGTPAPNSEFFRLDILGPAPEDEENIRIPDGYYTIDVDESFKNYSILKMGSTDYLYVDNAGEAWTTQFTYAELHVDGNSMYLMAVVEDKEYHVTFDGDYTISYNKLSDDISSITDNYEIDLSNCTGTKKCFGDYWGCGYCNWQIEFICNDGLEQGTYLSLDFLTDTKTSGSSGIEGTYRSSGFMENDPSQPNWGTYTFIPGFRVSEIDNYMMGSVIVEYIDGTAVEQISLYGGEFTITANSNGTYTIVINATDDADPEHKVTLNWTGVLN